MFGSAMLDIAVGVVFTFLLLSIFATAINEIVASRFSKRGNFLLRGIQSLLDDEPDSPEGGNGLTARLYQSGEVCGLYKGRFTQENYGNLPSYIPPANFSAALLTIVQDMYNNLLLKAPAERKAADDAVKQAQAEDEDAADQALKSPKDEKIMKVAAEKRAALTAARKEQEGATLIEDLVTKAQAEVQAAAAKAAAAQPPPAPAATAPQPSGQHIAPITPDIVVAAKLLAQIPRTEKVGKPLVALIHSAGNDCAKLHQGIGEWYNSAMDRVSGQYKYKTQKALTIIGIIMAVTLNADAISIVKQLSKDPTLRQSLVAAAQFAPNPKADNASDTPAPTPPPAGGTPPTTAQSTTPAPTTATPSATKSDPFANRMTAARSAFDKVEGLGIPLGWPPSGKPADPFLVRTLACLIWIVTHPAMILGWILTAVAISVGAPFWFDALNKIMVIRSTVKPAEKSPPEKSKS